MCCVTGRTEKERLGVLRVGSVGGEGRMKTQERPVRETWQGTFPKLSGGVSGWCRPGRRRVPNSVPDCLGSDTGNSTSHSALRPRKLAWPSMDQAWCRQEEGQSMELGR